MSRTINKISKVFPSVILTGPRQIGKTTLLKENFNIKYVTLDDPIIQSSAALEPGSFFNSFEPPLIIDEVQYAPELFPYIKMFVDNSGRNGEFLLTGSQQFQLMKNVSESLAGRIAVLPMLGLSNREIREDQNFQPFLPSPDYYELVEDIEFDVKSIWESIYKGSMPAVWANDVDVNIFYGSYLRTYIERDVKSLTQVADEQTFLKFMRVVAANTGQMLNLANIANDVDISATTAKRWLSILVTSGIVYLLQPYHTNKIKTIVKTPKVYFLETGLAAYLLRWTSPEVLEAGASSGAFFETFVISEIIKSYYNVGKEPPIYYYRDGDKKEIDIIFEDGDDLYPVEIKKTSNPHYNDAKVFGRLDQITNKKRKKGAIICLAKNLLSISEMVNIVPVSFL
jgi:predicted AAA+ superfamily ATPase